MDDGRHIVTNGHYIHYIEGSLIGHSDFIRQDIISFVRVHIKKWRDHCLRRYHSVDRSRRFPLSKERLSITFYSKLLIIIIKVLKFRQGEDSSKNMNTPQNFELIKQGELLYSDITVHSPNLYHA